MLKFEYIDTRIRHYSDSGMKIRQIETGIIYDDAVDVLPCRYTYEETDQPIEVEMDESDITAVKAAAYDILMGVDK